MCKGDEIKLPSSRRCKTAVLLLGMAALSKSRSQKTEYRYLTTWSWTKTSVQIRKEMSDIISRFPTLKDGKML